MKIYFIGQKGIPVKFGGVEKHVEDLAVRLVKVGHEVYVYTRPHYTDKNLKTYQGVNLISLPTIATKHLDAIVHTFRACLDIRKRPADIIHFQSIGPSSLIWLVKILKPGVPVVATFHTRCYEHKKWGIFSRLYLRFGELIACLLADKTITVSQSLKDYVIIKYNLFTEYIPNGVALPKNLVPQEIKKWGLTRGNYIITVSRLVRHKGIQYLIQAYKNLKTKKKLVIVGDGAYTDDYVKELKELARENKKIIFTGNQTGKILAELFSNAYLFVQPSESEGLSIALLEAMSYKLGVLTSDIPENREVLAGSGYNFKNKSVKSLQNKLSYLLKHPPEVKRIGEQGRNRVKENYNWPKIVAATIKIYHQAILAKTKNVNFFCRFKLVRKIVNMF